MTDSRAKPPLPTIPRPVNDSKLFHSDADDMRRYKAKIGNYEIEEQRIEEVKGDEIQDVKESLEGLKPILEDPEVKKELYKGCTETKTTSAREAFINKLAEILETQPRHNTLQNPIRMEEFLGKEGLKLYYAALKEEYASKEFRDAVFLESTKHFKGPSLKKKLVLWVGGPSASGKSTARDFLFEKISSQLEPKRDARGNEVKKGNYVVSVDGGVEREVSQMRQLLLQTSGWIGYKGLDDLDASAGLKKKAKSFFKALAGGMQGIRDFRSLKKPSAKIKSKIKKAAEKHKDLHIAIPATFTNLSFGSIKKYAKRNDVQQVFSRIVGGKTSADHERFRNTVERLGNDRAWSKKILDKIKMNARKLGYESKKYSRGPFQSGVNCSAIARRFYRLYQKIYGKEILDFTATNDLIYIKKDNTGNWVPSEPNFVETAENPVIRLTERGYNAWKLEKHKEPDLRKWWQANKNNPRLSGGIVDQDLSQAVNHKTHPFFLKFEKTNRNDIQKAALTLISMLAVTFDKNKMPKELEELDFAIQRILNQFKDTNDLTDLLVLCDALYYALIHRNPENRQLLNEKLGMAVKAEPILETKTATNKTTTTSSAIHKTIQNKELELALNSKLEELSKKFGVTVFTEENYSGLDAEIAREAKAQQFSHVLQVEDGLAKGAVFADKNKDSSYCIYSLRGAEDSKGVYEEAKDILQLFITTKGSGTPIKVFDSSRKDLKEAILVLGFANNLDLRDEQLNKLALTEEINQKIEAQRVINALSLDLTIKANPAITQWAERISRELGEMSFANLDISKRRLCNSIETAQGMLKNPLLSPQDKIVITDTLEKVQEKLTLVNLEIEKSHSVTPVPVIGEVEELKQSPSPSSSHR